MWVTRGNCGWNPIPHLRTDAFQQALHRFREDTRVCIVVKDTQHMPQALLQRWGSASEFLDQCAGELPKFSTRRAQYVFAVKINLSLHQHRAVHERADRGHCSCSRLLRVVTPVAESLIDDVTPIRDN